MQRDESSCNTYNYGDAVYWDARYVQEVGSFDWYQRYSALRPFVRRYVSNNARVLMVGCGNAVMSEDMVKDGYEDIVNIDISSVAIDIMKKKYEHVPQLTYMQMDVRDMSSFPDESYDAVIDKGTLDSLMCGTDAPLSAAQMLGEVSRLLKPGGVYMLITYGDPTVRVPHLNRPVYDWQIKLYIIPRPGFQGPSGSCSSLKSFMEPVPTTEDGHLPADYVLEDPDSHFIYVCTKLGLEDHGLVEVCTGNGMNYTQFKYSAEVAKTMYVMVEFTAPSTTVGFCKNLDGINRRRIGSHSKHSDQCTASRLHEL